MKKFNIAKSHFLLNDHRMSINEVYGQFTHVDGRKIIYRLTDFSTHYKEITHYVEKGKEVVPIVKKYPYFKIYLWNDTQEIWQPYNTSYKPLRWLYDYLSDMFKKCNISENTQVIKYIDKSIPDLPYLKKYPKPMYDIDIVGYALNKRIITNGYNGFVAPKDMRLGLK